MTPFTSLLLPIAVAAIAVFILTSVIHMAMPWHKSDYGRVPDDDAVLDALRPLNIPPGDYMVPSPYATGGGRNPEFTANHHRGPNVLMTIRHGETMKMGKYMGQWFLFTLLIAGIAGCVTGSIVKPGGDDHAIFHYASIVTFCSYTLGAWPLSIWYHRKWSTTLKGAFDALIYGVATGLVFAWMWPKA